MFCEVDCSLLLQLGNEVVKEVKFVSRSFVVVSPEENLVATEAVERRLCPFDGEVAGEDDVIPDPVSAKFAEEIASWSEESVHDNDSELLGRVNSECKNV